MDKKQLKQHKSTFHFGVSVRYEKILIRGYGDNKDFTGHHSNHLQAIKEWKQKQVPIRTGIVIGWRWLSNGIGNYSGDDGNCYTAIESLFAIEIKRGMMNRVDLVLPESLQRDEHPGCMIFGTCTIPDRTPIFNDHDKKLLRDCMKSVSRDSRGRWK